MDSGAKGNVGHAVNTEANPKPRLAGFWQTANADWGNRTGVLFVRSHAGIDEIVDDEFSFGIIRLLKCRRSSIGRAPAL
jgi:hypothetical protein